jgi:hypothetical protein
VDVGGRSGEEANAKMTADHIAVPPSLPPRRFPLPAGVRGSAEFGTGPGGSYRYWLERRWDDSLPHLTYLLLNPSAAGAEEDDPTTQKLRRISSANGGGSYELVNLFAAVDTQQLGLDMATAVGESSQANDRRITAAIDRSQRLVIGWGDGNGKGSHVGARRLAIVERARQLWPLLSSRLLWCVGSNAGSGSPRHPGQGVRKDVLLVPYLPTNQYPGP